MRVLILGIDGYLGWPTAMSFSNRGHDVLGVDNYLRRNLCRQEDVDPLFPTPNLHERARIWESYTGKRIYITIGDLAEWSVMSSVFEDFRPDVIIHYAEQPSAPFSMLSREAATLTLRNNLMVTSNVIFAVREYCPDSHIVKLGTMGEYGTPNIDIEEGFIEIDHNGRNDTFLYPRQASSLYHTTKIMDTDLLWFYVRTWNLRVTDLMQGPVYGLFTDESQADDKLLPFFNYDEIFGTVINRFLVQAVAGYPLTVYGRGGQTRGYLNIKDTLNCIHLAAEHPPERGELRIFNQFTETFTVKELANKIKRVGEQIGLEVTIQSIPNPRIEAEEHYYNPKHTGLLELGLKPHYLTDHTVEQLLLSVYKYKAHIYISKILQNVNWK